MPHLFGSVAQSGMNSELKIEYINRRRKVITCRAKKKIEKLLCNHFLFYFQVEVI